ncbi:ArsR/SmtB family transcription factor [Spirochaeta dissipatitropha]
MKSRILMIDLLEDLEIIKGLSSEIRVRILNELRQGPKNVNEIAALLELPQSTVATNILILEKVKLVSTKIRPAAKGNQKICYSEYDEYVIHFPQDQSTDEQGIKVEMPVGLFIECDISAPCGMCTQDKIVGFLDTPESFLEPERVKAGLLWFEQGYIKYQFPNNSISKKKPVKRLELIAEMSSEIPGTNPHWLSDITVWINEHDIGTWTSPGDFGDKRGKFTPAWWKLEGSQYGLLKTWRVDETGCFIDGHKVSDLTIADLKLSTHHSIKVTIGIKKDAENVGGINIFGKGFGNYDHDLILQLSF